MAWSGLASSTPPSDSPDVPSHLPSPTVVFNCQHPRGDSNLITDGPRGERKPDVTGVPSLYPGLLQEWACDPVWASETRAFLLSVS